MKNEVWVRPRSTIAYSPCSDRRDPVFFFLLQGFLNWILGVPKILLTDPRSPASLLSLPAINKDKCVCPKMSMKKTWKVFIVFAFSKCNLASKVFLIHVKKPNQNNKNINIDKNKYLYKQKFVYAFLTKLLPYNFLVWNQNAYLWKKSAFQGETQEQLLKYILEGRRRVTKSFYIYLSHAEGPPPLHIFGVLKSLSIRRPTYKPNDTWLFVVCTEKGLEKCCIEKEKPGQNATLTAFKKAPIHFWITKLNEYNKPIKKNPFILRLKRHYQDSIR